MARPLARHNGPRESLEVEKRLYQFLYDEGPHHILDIIEEMDMEESYIRTRLQCMVDDGSIQKSKLRKGDAKYYYFVP